MLEGIDFHIRDIIFPYDFMHTLLIYINKLVKIINLGAKMGL